MHCPSQAGDSNPPAIDIISRPNFVNKEKLQTKYSCALCYDILLHPQQTSCGSRVCKSCINNKFGDYETIPCPVSHGEMCDNELIEEPCQQTGLKRNQLVPDFVIHRVLLNERCFCQNQLFGCQEQPLLKNLQEHHKKCERAETQCDVSLEDSKSCGQKTDEPSNIEITKCYYYEYCKFEASTLTELNDHMLNEKYFHIEALTVRINELDSSAFDTEDPNSINVEIVIDDKLKPLERLISKVALTVKQQTNRRTSTNEERLKFALEITSKHSIQVEQIVGKVEKIERRLRKFGLDKKFYAAINDMSTTQTLYRHNKTLRDLVNIMNDIDGASYDGTLIWVIPDYWRKKYLAVSGLRESVWSRPFYTRRYGYKLCCRADLNGEGAANGKYMSLFVALMRGECDELLTFPFKQKITFSLLCSTDSYNDKHLVYTPDPDSSSFIRPQTEMNIEFGCPQFALQSEVESGTYLTGDSICIRVKVEPGGDIIS